MLYVLESTIEEVTNRLIYHSTFIIELLGNLFTSLNRLNINRHAANPTNRIDEMVMPEGVTSDVFRNLYGRVLVFKRYDCLVEAKAGYSGLPDRHLAVSVSGTL